LLEYKLQGGDPRRFTEYEKFVSQLTVKDLQQAAKLVFEGNNKFTAVLMPENYKEKSTVISEKN
jgi:predicted Zn-dependent peptidase